MAVVFEVLQPLMFALKTLEFWNKPVRLRTLEVDQDITLLLVDDAPLLKLYSEPLVVLNANCK